jgi:hypothetical protein
MARLTRKQLDERFPVAKRPANEAINRRAARLERRSRHIAGAGYSLTDKGGGSGRIGARPYHSVDAGSQNMRPGAGSALARAMS